MRKTKHSISEWLNKHGDPKIEKQVEEELVQLNKRRSGMTTYQWLKENSTPDDSWFKKAKRRQRFKWLYDFIFYVKLEYIKFKKLW